MSTHLGASSLERLNEASNRHQAGDVAGAVSICREILHAEPLNPQAWFGLGLSQTALKNYPEALKSFSRAVELNPSQPEPHLKLANLLSQLDQIVEAEAAFRRSLALRPDQPGALTSLANVLSKQRRIVEAEAVLRQALSLRPDDPIILNNWGNALSKLGRVDEAEESLRRALQLRPDYAIGLATLSAILHKQKRLAEATEVLRRAVAVDPAQATAHTNLGILLLAQGDFAAGWPEFEWRRQTPDSQVPQLDRPDWDGSSLDGKTILLAAEQGLGDTIQFIRFATELKQRFHCRIVAAVHRPLLPLLGLFADVDQLVSRESDLPACDCWAPLFSLPRLLGHNAIESMPAKIPYLDPRPDLVERWKNHLSQFGGFKIGIVWSGETANPDSRWRSPGLAEFAPLGQLSGVTLISLQKRDGLDQLDQLAGQWKVVTLGDDFDSSAGAFMDTAAVMKGLDLVITADTATAHLAGALGVPTWVALPHVPHWTWQLSGDTTPWYPSVRLFRQPQRDDWKSVFEQMVAELKSQQPAIRQKSPAEKVLATSGFNRLTRAKHGLMLFNWHDRYIGRSIELYGEFSEGEVDLFRQVVRPGNIVIEAGANIGAHTLPLAQLVGERGLVFAFEPQRVIFQTLCANLALNSVPNVIARCEAVGEAPGVLTVPKLDYTQANNFGGLSLSQNAAGERVPVVTIDSLNLPQCNLLKVDVEGMEISVLRGAAQTIAKFRPVLYVENDRADNSPALIEHLQSLGYVLYWHLPTLFNPKNDFGNSQNEFGQTVSVNMLGFHSSITTNISGLNRVDGPHSDWRSTLSR